MSKDCSQKPPDVFTFDSGSSALLSDCKPLLTFLMKPAVLQHRWAASDIYTRVSEILLAWRDKSILNDIKDINLANWFNFATRTCADVLAAGLSLFERRSGKLVGIVITLCHLVVLGLGAYCAAILGRSWQNFPVDSPGDAYLFTPAPSDCLSAVLAVNACSLAY